MAKFDLLFSSPLMNAAGALGFSPDRRGAIELAALGAFITNPISALPRLPAEQRGCLDYPGGILLHNGHPNPGINAVLQRYANRWARSPLPVIVHLLAEEPAQVGWMMNRLEAASGVKGVELGLPEDCEPALARPLVMAGLGELPLIVRLPFAGSLSLAISLADLPLIAFSLGPPRGALPAVRGGILRGRLYGVAVFPQALLRTERLVSVGLPVIAGGGIYHPWQAQAMLGVGAVAVQLDTVLWRLGWEGLRQPQM